MIGKRSFPEIGSMTRVDQVSVAEGQVVTPSGDEGVPEPGQVVEVRGSTWAVAQVQEQGLPRSSGDEAVAGLNHVVTLQALDEDRLGEELTVVWELEVGHSITPDQGLPVEVRAEGFDDPNVLAGFVDAMRWGAVTSADDRRFQAPFHSGATVEAYQLEPLRRALSASRTNLLIARSTARSAGPPRTGRTPWSSRPARRGSAGRHYRS